MDEKYIVRFWSKVTLLGPDECWPWKGCVDGAGRPAYGIQIDGKHKTIKAYRFAFYCEHGRWAEPMVLHSCDNPVCCNPRHLREGTQAENMADARERRRTRTGERHWKAKLTDANVVEIRVLAAGGCSRTEIATRFGVSDGAVKAIIQGITWTHVPNADGSRAARVDLPPNRGENTRTARLTDNGVRRARELSDSGYSAREIAADLGVGRETINAVLAGRSWKHVK